MKPFYIFTGLAAVTTFLIVLFWPQAEAGSSGPPASTDIDCSVRWVHDGDTFRCDGYRKSTRLYGIDAPEMPGACRPGRQCTPGDPHASRDHLEALIARQQLRCQLIETDHYGRPLMRCWAGQTDLSCAMIEAGHAVERYGRLRC